MSVVVTLSDGAAHIVPIGTADTVGALVRTIHGTLALPNPASAYELSLGGDNEGLGLRADASLEEVGVLGCEEHVTMRAKYAHVVRAELAAEGITTAAAADEALEGAVARGALGRVRQIAAAGLTALKRHVAAALESDQGDAAEAMLAVDGDMPAGDLESLLCTACIFGEVRVVARLLAMGASPDALDAELQGTPLHVVCVQGFVEVAEMLLQYATVDVRANDGSTALHVAAEHHRGIAKMLLDGGADVNARNRAGAPPLHGACFRGSTDTVEMLLDGGADVNAVNSCGETSLHRACTAGHYDVVELLADRGADVNAKTVSGKTPLSIAIAWMHDAVVEVLVEKGAELDAESAERG